MTRTDRHSARLSQLSIGPATPLAIPAEAEQIDARGMRCPWPALRAARAMREGAASVAIFADDPIAPGELAALAQAQGWTYAEMRGEILGAKGPCFLLSRDTAR